MKERQRVRFGFGVGPWNNLIYIYMGSYSHQIVATCLWIYIWTKKSSILRTLSRRFLFLYFLSSSIMRLISIFLNYFFLFYNPNYELRSLIQSKLYFFPIRLFIKLVLVYTHFDRTFNVEVIVIFLLTTNAFES